MKLSIKKTAYLFWFVLLTIGLLGSPQVGKAQTPLPTTPTAPAIAPQTSPALTPGVELNALTLSSWGYDDVTIFGPSGFAAYDLGLPLHWQMQPGGSLTLYVSYLAAYGRVSATPAATEDVVESVMVASIQVRLNSQPIYETNLTQLGAHTLEITLPDVWPVRSGERDRLEVYLHVYGPCEDVQYSALQISKDSAVRLFYSPGPLSLELGNYPAPLYQRTFLPSTAVMVLPKNTNASITEAALAVAAGLGSRTNNRIQLSAITDTEWSDSTPLREHILLIGTPDNNPIVGKLLTNQTGVLAARLRELAIRATGPISAAPGSPLNVTVQITNPTTDPISGLELVSRLPQEAAGPQCQTGCTQQPGEINWEIGTLAAGETREFQLSYSLPESASQPAELMNELLRDGQPVNVASLETQLLPGAQPIEGTSESKSSLFFIYSNRAAAESDGVIALLESPWQPGKALLLVTGLSDEAVVKAGQALASQASFPGMIGPVALVQAVKAETADTDTPLTEATTTEVPEDATAQEAPQTDAISTQDITFAELGYEDLTVTGTGMKEIYYQFDMPLGWTLTEEAYIRLKYAYSPILNPDESAVTLLYNGTPIASAALTPETAVSSELIGKLPPKRSLPGRANNLLVRINLMLPDRCADPESTQAWLRIAPESDLHLAHYNQDLRGYLNMDAWPIPFAARSDLADVIFSLPGDPAPLEITTAIKLAAYLGAASGGNNLHPAATVGDGEQSNLGAYHVLAIGRPSRNPLLQKANSDLPQPFIAGSDGLKQQVDNVVLRLPDGLDIGILESIPSPWSADRVFLAVTGTSDAGLLEATDFMIDTGRNWELKGSLAMLRGGKIAVADPSELTASGRVNAIATLAPGAQVVTASTPTPRAPAPTLSTELAPTPAPLTYPERYPFLLPLVIVVGMAGIIAIGATIFRQRRTEK